MPHFVENSLASFDPISFLHTVKLTQFMNEKIAFKKIGFYLNSKNAHALNLLTEACQEYSVVVLSQLIRFLVRVWCVSARTLMFIQCGNSIFMCEWKVRAVVIFARFDHFHKIYIYMNVHAIRNLHKGVVCVCAR